MNNLVPHTQAGVPTTPQDMEAYYKQMAEAYAANERKGGSSISARNGVLQVGDQPIPGNQFAAVILDAVFMNTFYKDAFNPQNILPPTCYALAREEGQLAPHPDMAKDPFFQPQAAGCLGCPHNEFGSSGQGKGKRCSNRRRLIMLNAGTYAQSTAGWHLQPETTVEHYASTPLLNMALAPTSLGGWGQFVRDTAAQYQRPFFGVVARVFLYPHPKHGKEAIGFEALAPTPDEWGPTIIARHQEAAAEIGKGFDAPEPQQVAGGGFYTQQQQAMR